MKRIGIYGGSFNPPHLGHVLAAEEMIRLLDLDLLYVIPAGVPPHKALAVGSPGPEDRLELTRLAFAASPKTVVTDLELRREGLSFTVDTLEELKKMHVDSKLYLLMGTDMLLSFPQWKDPERIAALATLAVMQRGKTGKKLLEALWNAAEAARRDYHAEVLLVSNHCLEISSTQVRNLIAFDCVQDFLPDAVAEQIKRNGWYRHGSGWKQLPLEQLTEISLSLHDPKRIPHAIGCSETAVTLARRFGANETDAARAGILHDVTKALGPAAQLSVCNRYQIPLTQAEQENPKLLHAKTGATVAREIFGENEAVCSAIFWHTTGHAGMTLLEKIIYLADYMEPNRTINGVERLRALAQRDLDAAVLEGVSMSLDHLRKHGKVIDENSKGAYEDLLKGRES